MAIKLTWFLSLALPLAVQAVTSLNTTQPTTFVTQTTVRVDSILAPSDPSSAIITTAPQALTAREALCRGILTFWNPFCSVTYWPNDHPHTLTEHTTFTFHTWKNADAMATECPCENYWTRHRCRCNDDEASTHTPLPWEFDATREGGPRNGKTAAPNNKDNEKRTADAATTTNGDELRTLTVEVPATDDLWATMVIPTGTSPRVYTFVSKSYDATKTYAPAPTSLSESE